MKMTDTDKWEEWKKERLKAASPLAFEPTAPMTVEDMVLYEKAADEALNKKIEQLLAVLNKNINTEIERVCREQDEYCIAQLCKVIDEKFEDLLASLDE